MTDKEAIERLKRIDIKFFLSGMYEQSNYIVDEADKTNKAIEKVVNLIQTQQTEIEKKDKIIDLMIKVMIDSGICDYFIKQNCKHYAGENKKLCDVCIKEYFERKVEEE